MNDQRNTVYETKPIKKLLQLKILDIETCDSFLLSPNDLREYTPIYTDVNDCVPVSFFLKNGFILAHHVKYTLNIECIPTALEALGITKENVERVIVGGGNILPASSDSDDYDDELFVGPNLKYGIKDLLLRYFNEEVQIEVQPPLGWQLNLSLDCTKQGRFNVSEYNHRRNSKFKPESVKIEFNTPHILFSGYNVGRPSVFTDGEEYKKNTKNHLKVGILKSDSKKLKPFAR